MNLVERLDQGPFLCWGISLWDGKTKLFSSWSLCSLSVLWIKDNL